MTTRTNYKKNRSFDFKLISLVENYPTLYKKQNGINHYQCMKLKNVIWQTIAEQMQSTKTICIRRWTNLRGQYTKELRLSRELCPITGFLRGSHWPYLEQLSFLEESQQTNKPVEKESSPVESIVKSEPALESDNDGDDNDILINCGKLPENMITDDLLEKLESEGYVLVEEIVSETDDQNAEVFEYIPQDEGIQQEPVVTAHVEVKQQQPITTPHAKVMQQQPIVTPHVKGLEHQTIATLHAKVMQQQPIVTPHVKGLEHQTIATLHAKVMQQQPIVTPHVKGLEHRTITTSHARVMKQQLIATPYVRIIQQQPIATSQARVMQQQSLATSSIEVKDQDAIPIPQSKVRKQEPIAKPLSLENSLNKIRTELRNFDDTNRAVVEQRILDFLRKVSFNTTDIKTINNMKI